MAIVTIKLAQQLADELGAVPVNLAAALRPLLAAQRDEFVAAWLNASEEQRQRPADQWVLREEDRDLFTRFQAAMLDPVPEEPAEPAPDSGSEPVEDSGAAPDSGAVSEP